MFGGTWSTSPDPVDFHTFVNVDLYGRHEQGTPRSFMRGFTGDQGTHERFSKREVVLGEYGGQMASFEWVFSPRGPVGRPMRLYDRSTGTIDRTVADVWTKRYDLARLLGDRSADREIEGVMRMDGGWATNDRSKLSDVT